MRISEHFQIGLNQSELDFVDVDVVEDTALYLDPSALRSLDTEWARECVSMLQTFFTEVLRLIKIGDDKSALTLLEVLREPNETHLGQTKSGSPARGRGLGENKASYIWEALSESQAATSGLLEDLEDSALMVPGIDRDLVSDITTNVIRGPLIRYSQSMCDYYSIELSQDIVSGSMWNPHRNCWFEEYVRLPTVENKKILLVPKIVVRQSLDYSYEEYFRYYILPFRQKDELDRKSELVQVLKNGARRVTKRSLIEKYGEGKIEAAKFTVEHQNVLERFRRDKRRTPQEPLKDEELGEPTDWEKLLATLKTITAGNDGATEYELAIQALLTPLFYPELTYPVRQSPIHEGRKRLDIRFHNASSRGFFHWVHESYFAPYVMIECKNCSADPANPELDQISGRLGRDRGWFGILICRQIRDLDLFMKRCKDTAADGRGYVLPLSDSDLTNLVDVKRKGILRDFQRLLTDRFSLLT